MSHWSKLPSPPPRMSEDDVGEYYVREDGSVWILLTYAAQPTASLERLWPYPNSNGERRERIGGVVGAPIFAGG